MAADSTANFDAKVRDVFSSKGGNNVFLTREKYSALIEEVKCAKSKTTGKTPRDFHVLDRYDVLSIADEEKLIVPIYDPSKPLIYFVSADELYACYSSRNSFANRTRRAKQNDGRAERKVQKYNRGDCVDFLESM